MRSLNFKAFLGASLLVATTSWSTPVLYKGGTMISAMMHSDYNQLHTSYSLSSSYALGVTYEEFKSSNVKNDRYYYLQNNVLLKRFFQDDSQGNIYAKFGAGYREIGEELTFYGGAQADWETRTFYTALTTDMLATKDNIKRMESHYRIGVSPYEAKYNDLQAWLLLQISHSKYPQEEVSIHKTALWEIGSDLKGNWMMHFTIHL